MTLVIGKIGMGEKVHAVDIRFVNNGFKPGTKMKLTRFMCADGCNPRFTDARQTIDETTPATIENVTCKKCLAWLNK